MPIDTHPSSPNGHPRHRGSNRPALARSSDSPPPRRRINAGAIANGIRETWAGVVRVLRLVWATSRALTAGLATTNLLQSVVPVIQVWLAGQLIDAVVAGYNAGGDAEHVRNVVYLAVLQLLIFLGSSLLQSVGNISQQLLQERVVNG